MLLPTKHIRTENAVIGVGAELLLALDEAKTVSRLYSDLQSARNKKGLGIIHFDWFLIAIDFLYAVGALKYEDGLLKKLNQ